MLNNQQSAHTAKLGDSLDTSSPNFRKSYKMRNMKEIQKKAFRSNRKLESKLLRK